MSQKKKKKRKKNKNIWDFPGGPLVKTSPSNAGAGSIPGQGTKIPKALQPENWNENDIVTNAIKTLKGVHIKKKKKKKTTDKKESSEKGVKMQSFFEYQIVGSS